MGAIGFAVDVTQFVANVKKLTDKIPGADKISALAVGNEVLRLSQIEVPHDEGSLQNSGTVETIDNVVIVGYHEPYAARLHEHPEYNFQKGRKGKYLSDPIVRNAAVLGLKYTQQFGEAIK